MTHSSLPIPHRYEVGDHALLNGTAHRVTDVDYNPRGNCPCGMGCTRIGLEGAGYRRACEIEPAPKTKAEPKPARIPVGESREFDAGRYRVAVTRTGEDAYRVVALDWDGHAVAGKTAEFDDVSRLPAGMSNRKAAALYMLHLVDELTRDGETPAQVAERVQQRRPLLDQTDILLAQPGWRHGYLAAGRGRTRQMRRAHELGLVDLDEEDGRLRGATLTDAGRARRERVLAAREGRTVQTTVTLAA